MRPEDIRPALGFDDIGLACSDSTNIRSRKEVDISTKISKNHALKIPLISSPMDTVSDVEMCIALNKLGAAGVLHRFMPISDQVEKAKKIKEESGKCYVAIGLKDYHERMDALNMFWRASPGPDIVDVAFLDTANGSSIAIEEFMRYLKDISGTRCDLIIGNTQTKSSVKRAINLGADGVRHGIGIGSQCITSVQTGIECPPVTSLYYGWKAVRNDFLERSDIADPSSTAGLDSISLLLDGGIREPRDLVKAIACGADAVISGSIFAGTDEASGNLYVKYKSEIIPETKFRIQLYEETATDITRDRNWEYFVEKKLKDMEKYKRYRGMASQGVIEDYKIWDGEEKNRFVEGKESLVSCKGPVEKVVHEYVNGLKSAMSYLGYSKLDELKGSIWTGDTIAVRLSKTVEK